MMVASLVGVGLHMESASRLGLSKGSTVLDDGSKVLIDGSTDLAYGS